jgi:hypothetical protein
MGLNVIVGIWKERADTDEMTSFGQDLNKINGFLRKIGQPPHLEPRASSTFGEDIGYSGIQRLRRLAAHLEYEAGLPENLARGERATSDPSLRRYYERKDRGKFDHLIQHSDCEGYYLPRDFPDVLFCEGLHSQAVGSVVRLQSELKTIKEALQIPLDQTSGTVARRVETKPGFWKYVPPEGPHLGPPWHYLGLEAETCLQMLEACQTSLETGCALIFS